MSSIFDNAESATSMPGRDCPWPVWAVRLLAFLFVAMAVMVIFDRAAEEMLPATAWAFLAVAAITDLCRGRRRVAVWLGILLAVFVPASLMAWRSMGFTDIVHNFVRYQIGVIWVALAWVITPIFVGKNWPKCDIGATRLKTWSQIMGGLVLAMAGWATVSAAASVFPKDSIKLLGSEILPYVGLFVVMVRLVCCADTTAWKVAGRSSWLLIVLSSFAMAMVAVLALIWPHLGDAFLRMGLFRVDSDAPDTRRLQFLFYHHNRAGFFAACAMFICLAGTMGGRCWRILGVLGCTCAAVALPFTLTRGALFAAAGGMGLFILVSVMRRRRGRWLLLAAALLGIPALWFGLPERYQGHIEKSFNLANYREDATGSIGARFIMWDVARHMIVERPVLGFGYGFENFESEAQLEHPEIPSYFKNAVHAHNMWLETGAEVGIPGAVLLGLFTLVRLAGLFATWIWGVRNRRSITWLLLLWICLELVVLTYGMTNYTLRRNLGFMTYGMWGTSVLLVIWILNPHNNGVEILSSDGRKN